MPPFKHANEPPALQLRLEAHVAPIYPVAHKQMPTPLLLKHTPPFKQALEPPGMQPVAGIEEQIL